MKKKIKSLFSGVQSVIYFIIKKIDKYIIVPITKLYIYISNMFENNGKRIEMILSKKQTIVFISMFLSLTLFLLVDSRIIVLVENSAEVLYNQPVTAIYNTENYVIEGLPETVDVTLVGQKSELYFAKQLPTQDITIDLSNLKPGSHTVSLKYKQSLTSIDYKIDPSEALIVVYEKETQARGITIDLLNEESLDPKLNIKNISLEYNNEEKNSVTIKGADKTLKTVASVKALIDIEKLSKQVVGEIILDDVVLVAYDSKGQVVDVEFDVNELSAKIEIGSDFKEVPIKVVPKGQVALGKAINSFTLSEDTVTIYASPEILEKITEKVVEIDVNGLKDNKSFNLVLDKTDGIKYMDVSTVKVDVQMDEEVIEYIENVTIDYINIPKGFRVIASNEESAKTTVIVRGTKSVIDSLDKASITVYANMSDIKETSNSKEINVEVVSSGELRVSFTPVTTTINVIVSRK